MYLARYMYADYMDNKLLNETTCSYNPINQLVNIEHYLQSIFLKVIFLQQTLWKSITSNMQTGKRRENFICHNIEFIFISLFIDMKS